MPLIQGKGKKSFEKNVKAEVEAGKPSNQALAIAYNIKRHNARKNMANGGTVDDLTGDMAIKASDKLDDKQMADSAKHVAMGHAASIAKAILGSKSGYADGGLVQEDDHGFLDNQSGQGDEVEAMSESGDDFLSWEPEEELKGVTNTNKRLAGIFNGIRMGKLRK